MCKEIYCIYLVVSMNTWLSFLLRQAGTSKHWSSWSWCVHAKWGSRDIVPDINLNTGIRRAVSFTLRPLRPRRRSSSTHSGWVSLHSWSEHPGEREILSAGNQTMTMAVQPTVYPPYQLCHSHYSFQSNTSKLSPFLGEILVCLIPR